MGLSASFSVFSAPSNNTIAQEIFVRSISVASEVSIARLVDTMLACDARICSSCRLVWMAPNSCYCCCSNYCRTSVVTSHTVSPMSFKSPSVRVIGSSDTLLALDFFRDPTFSSYLRHLMWYDAIYGSTPCYSIFSSIFSSVSGEGNLTPLLEPRSVLPVCFSAYWVASRSTWALSMTSFFLFLFSCVILSLVSSFFALHSRLARPHHKV